MRIDPLAYLGQQLAPSKAAGTWQPFRVLDGASRASSRIDGREVINLASNNYLGLATHPRLIEAAADAASRLGLAPELSAQVASLQSLTLCSGRNQSSQIIGISSRS